MKLRTLKAWKWMVDLKPRKKGVRVSRLNGVGKGAVEVGTTIFETPLKMAFSIRFVRGSMGEFRTSAQDWEVKWDAKKAENRSVILLKYLMERMIQLNQDSKQLIINMIKVNQESKKYFTRENQDCPWRQSGTKYESILTANPSGHLIVAKRVGPFYSLAT